MHGCNSMFGVNLRMLINAPLRRQPLIKPLLFLCTSYMKLCKSWQIGHAGNTQIRNNYMYYHMHKDGGPLERCWGKPVNNFRRDQKLTILLWIHCKWAFLLDVCWAKGSWGFSLFIYHINIAYISSLKGLL